MNLEILVLTTQSFNTDDGTHTHAHFITHTYMRKLNKLTCTLTLYIFEGKKKEKKRVNLIFLIFV